MTDEFWADVNLALNEFMDFTCGQRPMRVVVSDLDKPEWNPLKIPLEERYLWIRQIRYIPSPAHLATLKKKGHRTCLGRGEDQPEYITITIESRPIRAGSFFIY